MRQVKHFCRRETTAYHLYFWVAFGMSWEKSLWKLDLPSIASALLAGLLVLKASHHIPKVEPDRNPRHAPEP